MKILLSPAKMQSTTTYRYPQLGGEHSFTAETTYLLSHLEGMSTEELSALYRVKLEVAQQLSDSYQGKNLARNNALFAYTGIVFQQMEREDFTEEELLYANEHTYIMSALYGLLQPLTPIQHYRLDMGHRLLPDRKLREFWQDTLTEQLGKEQLIINLASNEFSSLLKVPMITIRFMEARAGTYKAINTYVKMARGQYFRWLIKNRVQQVESLRDFDWSGYHFHKELSTASEFVFVREE